MRELSLVDQIISEIDVALRTVFPPQNRESSRPNPAVVSADTTLSQTQKKHIAGLMRVNHSGEVCAQALYQGQAMTAQLTQVKQQMAQAAAEEADHLAWCEQRLRELDSQPSRLNPMWYFGSLTIGALAGFVGDRFSLGFVAETERQVGAHLKKHLENLPKQDKRSQQILQQMYDDETHHAEVAKEAGAMELPPFIRKLMQGVSKIMTKTSYYI
ncbi:2-polyprenyl-3-methyl-6-methoxy-1,4-benzoquinone monooxygenase [Legionella dresdenensis]|uniref:3-demethoxyubiquinol 3-hydroxylase n=1 Tax=Legionella dresdenensis TaxID=450200 RepID=A0ABV8CDP8_9GAMM